MSLAKSSNTGLLILQQLNPKMWSSRKPDTVVQLGLIYGCFVSLECESAHMFKEKPTKTLNPTMLIQT